MKTLIKISVLSLFAIILYSCDNDSSPSANDDQCNYQGLTFEDNGVGRKKSNEIKKRSLKKHQSKSTQILQDRIYLLNQSKKWYITYSITDLDKSKKQGTRVSLNFKQL